MKRFLSFVSVFIALAFSINAQDALVSVNGTVSDENTGYPVPGHEVIVIIGDSLSGGGVYQLVTNDQGYYHVDSIATSGYGIVEALTLDCNFETQIQEGTISPGINNFTFDFSICTDSVPPPGDCENWFWYDTYDNVTFDFYGESYPLAADVYLWDFGDGTTGNGQEVEHTFDPGAGDVFYVVLTTVSYDPITGDSCAAESMQEVWVGGNPGGDCDNMFWYETTGNFTYSFFGEAFPVPANEYMWDFGDGTTGEGQEIVHQFDQTMGDMFVVTLTTTSYDSVGEPCTATSSQEVWINNGGGGDCENWFWYDTYDNVTFDFYGESYPLAADVYLWDFGDGTTGNGQEVEHTFDTGAGDVFYVVLTTLSYDPITGDSCAAESMQEVWVGGNPGGDCDNMFWYETTGNFTYSFVGEAFPVPASYYVWDFGDGTTGEGQEVEHTFDPSLGDVFTVCLTTYSYDPVSDSCVATSCQDVYLSGQTGLQLMGTVYAGGDIVNNAIVGLFGTDSNGTFVFDYVMTDPMTGVYFFDNVPTGDYYIIASLTPQSPEFTNYFPTYYESAIFWFDATVVSLGDPNNPYDIELVPIQGYAPGPGNVGGTVTIGEGKGDPGNNITVLLMDEDENALKYTSTNEEGVFDFEDMSYGTYKLKVEMPGKNSEIATVVIDEDNQEVDLSFIVKSSSVILSSKSGFERLAFAGEIYPNPVRTDASISLTMTEPVNVTVSIYNQTGQLVYSDKENLKEGKQIIKLYTSNLPEGLYHINVLGENGGTISKKFIKIR